MRNVEILGVRVDVVDAEGLQARIEDAVREQKKHVFAYANIHALNIAQGDNRFRDILNRANLIYCDGEGVRLGARILGVKLPPRIVLTYWIWELCSFCEQCGFSIFLLGGTTESLERSVHTMKLRYPKIKIVGWHNGYFEKRGEQNARVLEMINRAKPDILLVGFGMPTQEYWIDENMKDIQANAILPAGSLIEYTAGRKRLSPAWMANHGMEWLFRLLQEPGRLWRRYILGNPLFMGRILLQFVRKGRQR
jgi:N-acetylglucosaminyldiphosphoundecaprenol N-acetyl-beta-D-mannosaminyltransferase